MIDSYLVLLITSICCSMLGVFLVLRDMSMIADAISHSVLLGIVIAFFITQDISSPWLIVGAGIFGVVTVAAIEMLGKSKRIMRSDAVGVVFPMFFSLAVILISRYARNAHIDTDIVLVGEVIFASLDTISIGGIMLPVSFIKVGIVAIINLIFIIVFYKQMKISTFNQEYAYLLGIPVAAIFYIFMTLTSLTAVVSFDAVGSILVLSFFITPAATAYLVAKDLKKMILLSTVFSVINCTLGTLLAVHYNASMSGMCAFIGMLVYLAVVVFNKKGAVSKYINNKKILTRVVNDMFIIHIGNHINDGTNKQENRIDGMYKHFNWSKDGIEKTADSLLTKGLIEIADNEYKLTELGEKRYNFLNEHYKLNNEGEI